MPDEPKRDDFQKLLDDERSELDTDVLEFNWFTVLMGTLLVVALCWGIWALAFVTYSLLGWLQWL